MEQTSSRPASRPVPSGVDQPAARSATRQAAQPAVSVRGLRRSYGSGSTAYEAVRGIDLEVAPGTIHALLGVNGAGKTSTLEVLEGLAAPTSGEVRVLGLDPVADRADVRRRTGVLLQRSGFVGDLTVRETLEMWTATVTGPRPVDELLELLSLGDKADTRMRGLSGGEHRRVDLACALAGRPELVMLDEPTTGLDPESRRQVWRLVRELREQGASVLVTTHYLDEAESLADQVSIMRAGEIAVEGTVAEIVGAAHSQISFRTPAQELTLPAGEVAHDGELTVMRVPDLQPALTALLAAAERQGVRLERLSARTASLESVFLDLADAPGAPPSPTEPQPQGAQPQEARR